ncbi:MAG: serine hydrolase domain-containing protein [Rikenellaceae bacterium]|nr:serine hydrolase domain-containing protein [Rikenellaceae bacterium]
MNIRNLLHNTTIHSSLTTLRFTLFTLLLFTLPTSELFAQQIDFKKLDSLMYTLESNDRFMGSIAVAREGKVIYTTSAGYSDMESDIKADVDSRYRIGSISKMFTAVLVFKAIEDGRLSLDMTLDRFYPSVENSKTITVADMLNHHSGIHSVTDNKDYLEWNTNPMAKKDMVKLISEGKSEFEPNSKVKYSNSNYILLSFILEDVYGRSYRDILKKKIIKPLSLKYTEMPANEKKLKGECNSYKFIDKWVKESDTDPSIPVGAGAIVSTPSDLLIFIDALFSGKLLPGAFLKQMTTINEGFGYGIFPLQFYDIKLFGHTGGIDGFSSILSINPEDRVCVAITSNGNNFNINTIFAAVNSCVYGKTFTIPSFSKIAISKELVQKYSGIYSSKQLPFKIEISSDGEKIFAQATNQKRFEIEATAPETLCSLDRTIVIIFKPETNEMTLKQSGFTFSFSK